MSTSELSAGPPGKVPLQPVSDAQGLPWDMNYWGP